MSTTCWCGWPASDAHGHFDWQPYSTRVGGPAAVETCHHSRLTPGCAPCWEAYAAALVKLLDDPVATVLATECPACDPYMKQRLFFGVSGAACVEGSTRLFHEERIRLALGGGK